MNPAKIKISTYDEPLIDCSQILVRKINVTTRGPIAVMNGIIFDLFVRLNISSECNQIVEKS